jgi:methylglutaconyl-CoA hydratase
MSSVQITREGNVLRVTLCRPERRNAFDAGVIQELSEAFVDVGASRAVVLSGEGPSFSAGADAEWMRAMGELEGNVAAATAMRRMFEAIDVCPVPVVAVVQGHALGGGAGLVACADIAIAETGTVFGFTEVKLGIAPAVISPIVLRRIGESAARRYFLTGERFDAAVALRIGLVHDVGDDRAPILERVLAALQTSAPRATRAAKRLVLERPDGAETVRRIADLRAGAEAREGLTSFLDGRIPGSPGFASWCPTEDPTE